MSGARKKIGNKRKTSKNWNRWLFSKNKRNICVYKWRWTIDMATKCVSNVGAGKIVYYLQYENSGIYFELPSNVTTITAFAHYFTRFIFVWRSGDPFLFVFSYLLVYSNEILCGVTIIDWQQQSNKRPRLVYRTNRLHKFT